MNIVILGAGDIGRYLATLLSQSQHNVFVIDKDKNKLAQLSQAIDVATRVGTGDDWQLLDSVLELYPDLLIAMTNSDDTNVVACSLAKQLGYPTTIARVHDSRYLNKTRLDFGRIFDVDHFICPELLAAGEVMEYIGHDKALVAKYFFHGAVQLKTIKISKSWKYGNIPLSQLDIPSGVMFGFIYRANGELIFPHGSDVILPGDEVTCIGETGAMEQIGNFFDTDKQKIRSIVLAGGSVTAYHLAKQLERGDYSVRILEENYERALFLAEHLPETTILNRDALDIDFLRSEKIDEADLMISCTRYDPTNLFAALLGREVGCPDVMMLLSDQSHRPLLKNLNIGHAVSPPIAAANRILSQVLTKAVNTLVSLYDNQVEVIEMIISVNSKVVGIPLADLGPLLPKNFLIAIIQNRGRIIVASGQRILSPGDTVIIITAPEHVKELGRIF